MTSGDIPHKSIKASSEKDGHPARHGRLGGDSYWCSKEEGTSYIQIHLPRKYKITAVGIHFKSKYNIRVIMLKAQVLNQWIDFHQQTPPYSGGVERIAPRRPCIAQSLRIRVIKKEPISICLRAEVYGCEIPRGCIMQGSAVFVKHSSGYQKGFVRDIYPSINLLEVFSSGQYGVPRADVILDEKPSAHELANGTLVLGKDVNSPGLIREGRLVQRGNVLCTIKTNDKEWDSSLDDVRVVKESEFCPS
ncbi:DNA damage responsive protein [Desmophyllum pertusum]|uniref:DNA damage responsive protein n=1 Tax=Desmophyllum pertusum TaxID=174260 RepID=A0A9W9Z6Q9_9CNID|nr:DNA damage responsive protein [Desmophyllum pertusum]